MINILTIFLVLIITAIVIAAIAMLYAMTTNKNLEYNFYIWFNVILHISVIPDISKDNASITIEFISE